LVKDGSVTLEEEDEVMDDEEYKRMIERRNQKVNQVRFSTLSVRKTKGERRMTIFNPLDPNNGSTFKFLAMNQSKPIL